MKVTCPLCKSPQEIPDRRPSAPLAQASCTQCGANLVLMRRPAVNPQATATPQSGGDGAHRFREGTRPPTAQRGKIVGITAVLAFTLIGYAVFAAGFYTLAPFMKTIAAATKELGPAADLGAAGPSVQAGQRALKRNEFREALEHFRRAAAQAPSSATVQTLRGTAAQALGEFDEALVAYRNSVKLNPSAANYARLGLLAERLGDTRLAVESLQAGLREGEDVAEGLFRVLVESGDRDRASALARDMEWVREGADYCVNPVEDLSDETHALLAMMIHPQHADCLLPVGIHLTDGGLVGLARLVLTDRIEHSPDPQVRQKAETFLRHRLPARDVKKRAESLNVIGYNLQYSVKNDDAAIQAYRKAIEADPSFSWPYHNLAQVHLNRGEAEQAMEWYRKAITVNPNHWKAQFNLGWVALKLKRYDEAAEAFRQAVALKPDDAAGHASLGRVLLDLGREAEGVRELRVAVQLDPRARDDPEFPRHKL